MWKYSFFALGRHCNGTMFLKWLFCKMYECSRYFLQFIIVKCAFVLSQNGTSSPMLFTDDLVSSLYCCNKVSKWRTAPRQQQHAAYFVSNFLWYISISSRKPNGHSGHKNGIVNWIKHSSCMISLMLLQSFLAARYVSNWNYVCVWTKFAGNFVASVSLLDIDYRQWHIFELQSQ